MNCKQCGRSMVVVELMYAGKCPCIDGFDDEFTEKWAHAVWGEYGWEFTEGEDDDE